ncbi:MAG: hypothetical protein ACHQF2_04015 [Flavobacteriales bacterium]
MSEDRIKLLKEWMQTDSTDPFLPYALALEFKKAGQLTETADTLCTLLNTFPDYLPVYYQLGILFEETGKKENALQVYRTGLQKAREQKDAKTAGEISEAIQRLEFD